MLGNRTKRTVATAVIAGSLFAGAMTVPAAATPGFEAQLLSGLKTEWVKTPKATQVTTCKGYKLAPVKVITLSTTQLWSTPAVRQVVTKPGLKRVITRYLAWACSGPGTTPR